jgi:glycosyltransferase involved in cell wall biosynthesis
MLAQALRSVREQTFDDFELLVVDDGSSDDTEAVVREFDDIRFKYAYQHHTGLPAASRNRAIRQAIGEYIAFLDSDDLWLPHKLSVQVAHLDNSPDVALTYSNAFIFRDDPDKALAHRRLYGTQGLTGLVFNQLYGNSHIPNSTVMIRASVLPDVGMQHEDVRLKTNEDYEYWLRIAHDYRVSYIDEPLALYRQHAHGISKASVAHFQAKLYLVDLLDARYPETQTKLSAQRSEWLNRIRIGLAYWYLRQGSIGPMARQLSDAIRQSPMAVLSEVVKMASRLLQRSLLELREE